MGETKTRDHRTNCQQFLAFANGKRSMALNRFEQGSCLHGPKLYSHLFVRWGERDIGNLHTGEPGCLPFLIFREEKVVLSAHWQHLASVPLKYLGKLRGRR